MATPATRPKGSVIDLTEDDDDDVQGKKKGQPAFMTMRTSSALMKENCKMLHCHRIISYAFAVAVFFFVLFCGVFLWLVEKPLVS